MVDAYSQLERFVIHNIELGKEIGRGAYGRILEAKWGGAAVAVKEIHFIFMKDIREPEFRALETSFIRECEQSSQLRHPNIVSFFGVHYPPGSKIPSLVMELLQCSLTDLLKQTLDLSRGTKLSVIRDVALGLRYLHTRTPIIIHRDLSSNNVLISKSMAGKIGDLGTVRFVDPKQQSQMTKAPGTVAFMPLEVLMAGDNVRYERDLDVFSFGCVMLHVLSHEWPTPSEPAIVTDPVTNKQAVVPEIKRRSCYFGKIDKNRLGQLIPIIEGCLNNVPKNRPSIVEVCNQLEVFIGEHTSADISDLPILQQKIKQKVEIQTQHQASKIEDMSKKLKQKDTEICEKNVQIETKESQIQRQANEIDALKSDITKVQMQLRTRDLIQLKTSDSTANFWDKPNLNWQKCADLLMKCYVTSIAELDGRVYIAVAGNRGCYFNPLVYDSTKDRWTELPKLPHRGFSLVTVSYKNQVLAIGGLDDDHNVNDKVFAWDEEKRKWNTPHPSMPTARYHSTSISHGSAVIVAGGVTCYLPQEMTQAVEVLHIKEKSSWFSKSFWSKVERLPHFIREAVPIIIDDNLYIAVGYNNEDESSCSIVTASLSELLENDGKKAAARSGRVWNKLPEMPYSSWSINHHKGHLIIFNGCRKVEESRLMRRSTWKLFQLIYLYNLDTMSWDCVGDDFHDYKLGKSVRLGKDRIFFVGGMLNGDHRAGVREDGMVKTCSMLTLTSK